LTAEQGLKQYAVASACLVTLMVLGFVYKNASVLTVWAWFATLTRLLVYSHTLFRDRAEGISNRSPDRCFCSLVILPAITR